MMVLLSFVAAEVLVYNRVWRTGSTGLVTLMDELSRRNSFVMLAATEQLWDTALYRRVPPIHTERELTNQGVAASSGRALVDALAGYENVLLHGHLTFDATKALNASRFTILRDPVARAVSEYGYLQNGCPAARHPSVCDVEKNASRSSLDDCVLDAKCRAWLAHLCRHQTTTVCGTNAVGCTNLDPAIQRDWLRDNYAVLGTTESLPDAITALEARFPRFFHGASALYDNTARPNANPTTSRLSPAVTDFLRGACAVDTALYDAVGTSFSSQAPPPPPPSPACLSG